MLLQPRQLAPQVPFTTPPVSYLTLQDYLTSLVNQYGGVYWPLDDAANNSYNRVINPAVAAGRQLVIDGTMEAVGTTAYTAVSGATLSKQAGAHDGSQCLRVVRAGTTNGIARQTILQVGRAYHVTGWVRGDGLGRSIPRIILGAAIHAGTNSNTWQQLDFVDICTSTGNLDLPVGVSTTDGDYCEYDTIVATELNIPAYNAVPAQLLNTDVWNGLGTAAWTVIAATVSMQTTTRHDGLSGTVIRIARNAAPPRVRQSNSITVGQVYRCYGWCRSDGVAVPAVTNQLVSVTYFTGTTSTDWQPFDFIFVADNTSICLQSPTNVGTQYVEFDVTVVSLDTGIRQDNVVQNGDFSADKNWTKGSGWTISGGTAVGTATAGDLAQSNSVVAGKKYLVTYTIAGLTSGTVTLFLGTSGAGVGAARSTNGTFSDVILCGGGTGLITVRGSGAGGFTGTVDNIVITELSPLVAVPVNGAVLGNAESNRLLESVSFDKVNDLINLYSAQLNGVFTPAEFTVILFGQVDVSGEWTDATGRILGKFQVDLNNRFIFQRTTTNNTLQGVYIAGATSLIVSSTAIGGSTAWFCLALTVSVVADQVKFYINGTQVGSTLTGLGTYVGNILSSTAVLASASTAAASVWGGRLSHFAVINTPLAIDYISEISKLGDAS